jgi:predicted transposase/invertase (TIGR01784 family)
MVQIWKQELTSVKPEDANKKGLKLPAIVPIVLYNGASKWDAVMRFKDLQNESERFGEYLVDFKYILISTNDYSEKDLLKVSNASSCIIMMDQKIVKRNKNAMIRRLNKIVSIQDKLPKEKIDLLYEWLVEVLMKRFPEREAQEIIQGLREAKDMTYAMERLFDELIEEGIEKGREEGIEKEKIETAKAALNEGASLEFIAKITGLKIEKIEELQKTIKH